MAEFTEIYRGWSAANQLLAAAGVALLAYCTLWLVMRYVVILLRGWPKTNYYTTPDMPTPAPMPFYSNGYTWRSTTTNGPTSSSTIASSKAFTPDDTTKATPIQILQMELKELNALWNNEDVNDDQFEELRAMAIGRYKKAMEQKPLAEPQRDIEIWTDTETTDTETWPLEEA